MKLTEARILFNLLRIQENNVIIYPHSYKAHPERQFTRPELITLVMQAKGNLIVNQFPSAVAGSFLFKCKDEENRDVEIAILIENKLIVIHAFRRIK